MLKRFFIHVMIGFVITGQSLAEDYTINKMGEECTRKIGVIRPFNCLDGEIIPVTVNDELLRPGQPTDVCDRPSFLAPAYCNPFSRIGRLPSIGSEGAPDADVQNIFICRRYNWVSDPDDPKFKDVAIIQHRKSTGETCFFQHLDDYLDATRVPPPAEVASDTPAGRPTADVFWLSPMRAAAINCNRCHDLGPFIHSPYVNQVKISVGGQEQDIVYPLPDLRNGEPNNYRFVGEPFQVWGIPEIIKPVNNKCVFCHVFGTQMSSGNYSRYSTGRSAPQHMTERYAEYPKSHWMPPDLADEMSEQALDRLYGESISQILSCGLQNTMASAVECNRQPFGP